MRMIRIAVRGLPVVILLLITTALALLGLGRADRTVEAQGEVRIRQYQVLRSQVPGLVSTVLVSPGERVPAGAELIRIQTPEIDQRQGTLRQQIRETQSRLAALRERRTRLAREIHPLQLAPREAELARSRLEAELQATAVREAEILLQAAKSRLEQVEDLAEAGLVSAQELQAARFAHLEVEQRYRRVLLEGELEQQRRGERRQELELLRQEQALALASLAAEIQEAALQGDRQQAELAALDNLVALRRIRAPVDGIVIGVPGNELLGRAVQPGDELLTIIDVESVYFVARVSDQALVHVRDGQHSRVEIVGLPRQRYRLFHGFVETVTQDPILDETQGGNRYAVEIRLENPAVLLDDGRFVLRSGMRGRAWIAFQQEVPLYRVLIDFLAHT